MRNRLSCLHILILACLLGAPMQAAYAQDAAQQDSARVYPEKMPDKTTWEQIVSLPGTILYFPVKLVFFSTQETVTFVQESETMAGLRRLLIPRVRIRGLLPAYSERSGAGLKYYFNDILGEGSKLTFNAKYGFFDNRQKHYARLQDIALGNGFVSTLLFQYRYLTKESFFGIGPQTEADAESSFSLEKTTAEVYLDYLVNDQSRLSGFVQFEHNNVFEGDEEGVPSLTEAPRDSLPGLQTRLKTATVGLKFALDSRDLPGRATKGWQLELAGSISDQIDGEQFRYWILSMDVKRVVHLFYNRTAVIRVLAQRARPFSGRAVPFYYLSELGQRETIRGYTRGRFRDNDLLMASIEYRYPIWHYFDAMIFCDAGQVASDLINDFRLDRFNFAFGAGIRVHSGRGLVLKIEIGFSNEKTRYYGVLNE